MVRICLVLALVGFSGNSNAEGSCAKLKELGYLCEGECQAIVEAARPNYRCYYDSCYLNAVPQGPIGVGPDIYLETGYQLASPYAFAGSPILCYEYTPYGSTPPPPPPPLPTCDPTLALILQSDTVAPAKTKMKSSTTVTAQLDDVNNSASCVMGKEIMFNSLPQEFTGGHLHEGPRPAGSFSQPSCTTDLTGSCSIEFFASDVSGRETIFANAMSASGSVSLTIKVPGLIDVTPFAGIIMRMTGQRPAHPANHFIRPENLDRILGIAKDVIEIYGATAGINDLSLEGGGLFDIGPKNPPIIEPKERPFWSEEQHISHRVGKSVDIDHCAQSISPKVNRKRRGTCGPGLVELSMRGMISICGKNKGHLVNEATIHCEFN